jgi:hypothetical protein
MSYKFSQAYSSDEEGEERQQTSPPPSPPPSSSSRPPRPKAKASRKRARGRDSSDSGDDASWRSASEHEERGVRARGGAPRDEEAEDADHYLYNVQYPTTRRTPELDVVTDMVFDLIEERIETEDEGSQLERMLCKWAFEFRAGFIEFEKKLITFTEIELKLGNLQRKHKKMRDQIAHKMKLLHDVQTASARARDLAARSTQGAEQVASMVRVLQALGGKI